MYNENKRGQLTIFIIIAIVVIALAGLIYMFFPQIKSGLGFETKNPEVFIQTCLEDELKDNIQKLSLQGGSLEPRNHILYGDEKVEYLCYTEEYYEPCVMQQPLLKPHIEEELETSILDDVQLCFDSLKESFESRGYGVTIRRGDIIVELLPEVIVATIDYSLVLTKDASETYDSFSVVVYNNLYELVGIANSILNWETRFGDAESTSYMNYYHDLKVEKKKQSDGSTIYILTDRDKGDKFQFASRSYVWPPGYGIGQVS